MSLTLVHPKMSYPAIQDAGLEAMIVNAHEKSSKPSDWVSIAKSKRVERAAKIPREWFLPKAVIEKYAPRPRSVFEEPIDSAVSPGILSPLELQLTSLKHDAVELCERLQSGAVSAEELTIAFCKRAAIAHQLTNCLSEIMFTEAITAAKQKDAQCQAQSGKNLGRLHGLPLTVKDHFAIKGYDTSIGITSLANKPAKATGQLVKILQQSGAIIISKTCVPQTMLNADTMSIVFGRTCNAYRGDLAASGSSGGEGALLALGGTSIGIGSDGAGSTRMPAFFNGVIGFKPSGYRYPLDGPDIMGKGSFGISSLGHVSTTGPLCRSVRDAQMITKLFSDAEPWEVNFTLLPSPWRGLASPDRSLRIGVWSDFDHVHLMPPVLRGFQLAQSRLAAAGHQLTPFNGPSITNVWNHLRCLVQVEDIRPLLDMISTEPLTEINRRTGIVDPPQPFLGFDMQHMSNLNVITSTLAANMTDTWNEGGTPLDALLWVPAPHPAIPFDEYTDLTFTALFNIVDWPAVTLPLNEFVSAEDIKQNGQRNDQLFGEEDKRVKKLWDDNRAKFEGLPLSVQLIGRRGQDEKLLAVSEVVQNVIRS